MLVVHLTQAKFCRKFDHQLTHNLNKLSIALCLSSLCMRIFCHLKPSLQANVCIVSTTELVHLTLVTFKPQNIEGQMNRVFTANIYYIRL